VPWHKGLLDTAWYKSDMAGGPKVHVPRQGFIQDFFLGGERLCVGKLISCGLGRSLLGGSGGMLPQKNFEILSPLKVIFKPSESDLRPSTD